MHDLTAQRKLRPQSEKYWEVFQFYATEFRSPQSEKYELSIHARQPLVTYHTGVLQNKPNPFSFLVLSAWSKGITSMWRTKRKLYATYFNMVQVDNISLGGMSMIPWHKQSIITPWCMISVNLAVVQASAESAGRNYDLGLSKFL